MEFALTPEQELLREEIREWARREVQPVADELDAQGVYPLEIIQDAAARGYTTLAVPREHGGMGLGMTEVCILMEEVGAYSPIVGVSLITILQGQTMIRLFGSERTKTSFLPRFRQGFISSYALTEGRHGSDIRSLDTKAQRVGDTWVINGRKAFVTSSSAADLFVILAETDAGVSVFLSERDRPGVSFATPERSETIGLRNGPHMDVCLSNCSVPLDYLCGREGAGVRQAVEVLDVSRTGAAAISLGIAQAAFESAMRWVMHRKAFDRMIFDFQGIQWKFVDIRTELAAARMLIHQAAWLLDRGHPAIEEASRAKIYASELATRAALFGMQVCGANGISVSAPFGRYLRDAKAYEVAGGSSEILRNTIGKRVRKEYEGRAPEWH